MLHAEMMRLHITTHLPKQYVPMHMLITSSSRLYTCTHMKTYIEMVVIRTNREDVLITVNKHQ